MSEFLAMSEIAQMIDRSKRSAERRADRESWQFTEQKARGGRRRMYALADLPRDVQAAIRKHRAQALVSSSAGQATPAVSTTTAADCLPAAVAAFSTDLTDRQRLERDARSGVLTAIRRLQTEAGCSQQAAIATLLTSARAGRLEATLDRLLRLARDPRGRAGDGYPSARSIKRWLSAGDLAPKAPKADMRVPDWAPVFLKHYQRPEKPTVDAAYRSFCEASPADGRPSIHQVRRFLAKLGSVTRERGRMGSRELKNIRPFIRRDFSLLEPNDVWSPDGHTFDAEVQHPLHGRPFRPEITTFIDIATRYAVGWSVDLAESGNAVADALRYGVERHGVPALIYADNGSGYRCAAMSDQATGLVGRIGAEITHSLPYNSQARGVTERFHKTVWVTGAKALPGFIGREMDREARLEHFKLSRKALKRGGALPLLPWHLFIQWCEERIAEYNQRQHRSLGDISPALAWANFEARGWHSVRLGEDELATLFRPRTTRTIARGEIRLFNNLYFARDLEEFHGLEAHVAYDIHNAEQVWVYAPDGRFICQAKVNGNSRHYFPVPVIEQARQKRAQGRLNRVEVKRDEILAEMNGAPALSAESASQIVLGGRVIDPAAAIATRRDALEAEQITVPADTPRIEPRPASASRSERSAAENYAEWQALDARIRAGESATDDETRWHASYPRSAQYKAQARKTA